MLATSEPVVALQSDEISESKIDVAGNVQRVVNCIAARKSNSQNVRLVAVSKTKPIELLRAAYNQDVRHFGENYVQEMVDKVPQMPDDVHWHFIGTLQSNKAGQLLKAG